MTGAQTLAAFRRAMIPALAVGFGVLALVVTLLLSRPSAYSARIGVVASPRVSNQTMPADYGAVVSLTMQALPELAVSEGTIAAIRAAVPDAPPAEQLRNAITVELVPGSSVARITVVGSGQDTTVAILRALLAQIQKANLLAPVAELKTIGAANPSAELVGRDTKLALGLGIVAGLISSLLSVVLVQTLRPRLLTTPDVERVVEEVFNDSSDTPPVVAVREDVQGLNLLAAHLLAQNPIVTEVNVVAAGPALPEDLASRLRNALRNLRVARDVGLPIESFTGGRDTIFGGRSTPEARHSTEDQSADSPASELEVPAAATAASTAAPASAPRRPGYFSPIGPVGSGPAEPERLSTSLSHLVVTVRLGKTTPTALTTALVAMRTHGTGVAGVAVG
jgi:capsular polysaccharide biosynthesis protein